MIRNITEDRMKTGTQPLLVCTVAASSATVTHLSLLSGPIRHLETHVRLSLLHRQSLCIQLNFWSGRLLFLDVCVSELLFSCSSQSAPQSVQRPGWCAGWLMRTKPTFAFPNAQQFIDIWFFDGRFPRKIREQTSSFILNYFEIQKIYSYLLVTLRCADCFSIETYLK